MKKLTLLTFYLIIIKCGFSQPVVIGNQVWMKSNLNVSTFRNGDPIIEAKTTDEWINAGMNSQPAWCYYDNNESNGLIHGKLYNYYAIVDKRSLCPIGWHVPSDDEWSILTEYCGGEGKQGKYTGIYMKNTFGWSDFIGKSGNGTNFSGFSALPSGYRNNDGVFHDIDKQTCFWSSSKISGYYAWYRHMSYGHSHIFRAFESCKNGYSVRCVKD